MNGPHEHTSAPINMHYKYMHVNWQEHLQHHLIEWERKGSQQIQEQRTEIKPCVIILEILMFMDYNRRRNPSLPAPKNGLHAGLLFTGCQASSKQ